MARCTEKKPYTAPPNHAVHKKPSPSFPLPLFSPGKNGIMVVAKCGVKPLCMECALRRQGAGWCEHPAPACTFFVPRLYYTHAGRKKQPVLQIFRESAKLLPPRSFPLLSSKAGRPSGPSLRCIYLTKSPLIFTAFFRIYCQGTKSSCISGEIQLS